MTDLMRVLLVEDDEDDYVLTRDLLAESRGGFRLEWVTTYDDALALMSQQKHDACLVDYRLGPRDGLELLRQAIGRGYQAPIIILTGQGDQEIDMAALKAGAADYLVKGEITAPLLERSIRYASERKRTEEEIRRLLRQTQEQAQQVQQIMDTVPDGVVLLDARRRIVLADLAARNFLPLLTEARLGDILTHLGGQDVAEIVAAAEGATWYELRLDGGKQIFEVTARPIDVETEPGGLVLVLRDVSEERQRQEFLQTQDRLATVGQLAAGIAHDFNNIMSVITLYSQTLQKNPNLPKRDYYLSTINQQASHAAALIARILDFSRRSVMERHPADLQPFLKEVVKLLQRTLPETIGVKLNSSDEGYLARVDLTRLQQVLMNLAVNARDAMPAGGKLRISLSRQLVTSERRPPLPEMESGSWLRLSIVDTGSGIAPEALPHIFEPFFTNKSPGQGTGLGLAQVYGIVKQHDGHIGVESRVGLGTTFTIYLPELVVAPAVTETVSEGSTPMARGQETILLVEDGLLTQEAIQETLAALQYRVLVARTGQEALALFRQYRETIDLVLSDMVMPEMGGVRLYQALQAQRPDVKLIIMTGYPLEDEGKTLLEQGIVTWLQKPFTPDEIARKVRQVLDEQEVSA